MDPSKIYPDPTWPKSSAPYQIWIHKARPHPLLKTKKFVLILRRSNKKTNCKSTLELNHHFTLKAGEGGEVTKKLIANLL
jgi:hypothetical protein